MNTIRIYLTESGRIADLQKDFPLYQGQFQNKLLNVFVPTSILAPMFTSSGAVSADYVASTSTKIGMTYTARDGSIKTSKNYYMRYLKTLMYKGVEYALYERKLPKEFTFYAGQGENSPVLIINVVNIEQQSGDTPPLVLSVITSQTCHLDVMQSTFLDRDELDEPSELENLNAQVQALNALMPKKQDKEDENIALEQAPTEKTVVGAINKLGGLVKTAQSSADTAQQTAETAQTTADNATTLANNAVATANSAVATANEAKTTAQTAETNANSALDTANAANATADEAKAIAQGSQRAIGFATLQAAITALNGYSNTQLKVGDNVYIVETGVPDLWVAAVEQNSVAYNYTTNDAFNDDLVENTLVQVGYYKFAYLESDGKPCTVAWQNMTVAASDWVASTEFADFPYEAKIALTDFVNFSSIPQVVFGLTEATSGNYAPICKAGDKGVYIYSKVNTAITLPTVVTFAPNVHGASMQGGGYTNKGKWVASTTYAIDDLVYTDNGQYVCIEGITSTTSPEQDTTHWQATFVATGKTKNGLKISGQNTDGSAVQKTFDGSTAVEVAFDETTMTTKEVNGVLKVGAKGTIPEALPQEASALTSGELPTTGWNTLDEGWKENTFAGSGRSVTYGNGKFVAADYSQYGAYSTDGISWTKMTLPANHNWLSVTYGNDKFVAIGYDSNKGAYSTDGITWTEFILPASRSWLGVTYGNGKFVAVAAVSNKGAYSTDGINWTEFTLPASRYWRGVTYGNDKFVAVDYDTGRKGAYSTDGINWTEMTMPAGSWYSVTYGNGKFVAVAAYGSNKVVYSTDGITWTQKNLPASRDWQNVTYGDGKFVAVAYDSNKGAYSTDGIAWTEMTMPASRSWDGVTFGNGKFVAVAMNGNGAYWDVAGIPIYTISDTSITANSDILMELTDDGGVKSYSMEAGKITVIRDTVPTAAIPYTYKVKQTNASGQFTLVNHFVPSVPESPTSLPVSYKKVSGELPTSGWTDANGFFFDGGMTLTKTYQKMMTLSLEDYNLIINNWNTTYINITQNETEHYTFGIYSRQQENDVYRLGFGQSAVYVHMKINKTTREVFVAKTDTSYTRVINKFYNTLKTVKTYSISDTSITANTAVKMYLTDEGGVKAYSKASGSIQVIRDEVPTTAIPYEYEVEQTSAEGLFEVINAYVPAVPTKTSQLTNDSGFAKTTEANTWTGVQTFSNADGIKTDRVHNLDNNDAWYNFDGSNNRFGSPSRPTIIRTSEARPRAQVPSGETTVTKEIALLEDIPSAGEWVDVTGETATLTQAGTYQVIASVNDMQSIVYWDGSTAAYGTKSTAPSVSTSGGTAYLFINCAYPQIDASGTLSVHLLTAGNSSGAWTETNTTVSGFKYRKIN